MLIYRIIVSRQHVYDRLPSARLFAEILSCAIDPPGELKDNSWMLRLVRDHG